MRVEVTARRPAVRDTLLQSRLPACPERRDIRYCATCGVLTSASAGIRSRQNRMSVVQGRSRLGSGA